MRCAGCGCCCGAKSILWPSSIDISGGAAASNVDCLDIWRISVALFALLLEVLPFLDTGVVGDDRWRTSGFFGLECTSSVAVAAPSVAALDAAGEANRVAVAVRISSSNGSCSSSLCSLPWQKSSSSQSQPSQHGSWTALSKIFKQNISCSDSVFILIQSLL